MSKVAIIMGSSRHAGNARSHRHIKGFDIETEVDIVSAHRTPENYLILVKRTQAWYLSNNCGCWWRGALPGMVASMSPLPVGVPVKSSNSIDGWDSVLSILQMPGGCTCSNSCA
jgi:5-(carboxyamino)imidazole ribonucleotide mutase